MDDPGSLFLVNSEPKPPTGILKISPSSSGLKLVLPPLKGGKPTKPNKRHRSSHGWTEPRRPSKVGLDSDATKIHRPAKLKPLKEVLIRLIGQIKKKDDYAFFLSPVDASRVTGYADLIKRPMDFGTMSIKAEKGRYRSLEEFTTDFCLVTSNAKLFNPPGTIYHTEAERIEAWGLEHISKASGTVVEYETDWNIEIEQDDGDGVSMNNAQGEDVSALEVDNEGRAQRSPSVVSSQVPVSGRRGPRGPYKKAGNATSTLAALEPDGRLPGSRDGIGAFPYDSDWARTMLALKLKAKRFKTKKERLRFEKEGPALCTDGSLDYYELEEPFSVLSALVPESFSLPQLTLLQKPTDASQPQSTTEDRPSSVNLPLDHDSRPLVADAKPKIRHWTITRNVAGRGKGRDLAEHESSSSILLQESQTTDWGLYSSLVSSLEAEAKRKGIVLQFQHEDDFENSLANSILLDPPTPNLGTRDKEAFEYWTAERALAAESYVRDVVYGGPVGLAYVRSLAEFAKGSLGEGLRSPHPDLGVSLTSYIEKNIIDPLTEGRHSLIRETASCLTFANSSIDISDTVQRQLRLSISKYPSVAQSLTKLFEDEIDLESLTHLPEELHESEKEWLGALYYNIFNNPSPPNLSALGSTNDRQQVNAGKNSAPTMNVGQSSAKALTATAERTPNEQEVTQNSAQPLNGSRDLYAFVLGQTADIISGLIRKQQRISPVIDDDWSPEISRSPKSESRPEIESNSSSLPASSSPVNPESLHQGVEEDPQMRELRLNLLALAKRAPGGKVTHLSS